jgi:hypothetical protein
MKETQQSALPAGSINKSRMMATVEYEESKGAILSRAQYEQMPEEFKSQTRVIGRDANGIAIEADSDVIDELLAWTMESGITLPGIDLGKLSPGKVEGMFRALEEARFYEDRLEEIEERDLA